MEHRSKKSAGRNSRQRIRPRHPRSRTIAVRPVPMEEKRPPMGSRNAYRRLSIWVIRGEVRRRLWSVRSLRKETRSEPDEAHRTVRPPPPPQSGASSLGKGVETIPVALPGRIQYEDSEPYPERGCAERVEKRVLPREEFPEVDPRQGQQNENDKLFGICAVGTAYHVRANTCPRPCRFLVRGTTGDPPPGAFRKCRR